EKFDVDYGLLQAGDSAAEIGSKYYDAQYSILGGDYEVQRMQKLMQRGPGHINANRVAKMPKMKALSRLSKGLGLLGKLLRAADIAKSVKECFQKSQCDCGGDNK